ncbi:MAG: cytochrome c [Acidobacteriota bacterium]|nr:cytochrome c [Acidobacteriota bacterium]
MRLISSIAYFLLSNDGLRRSAVPLAILVAGLTLMVPAQVQIQAQPAVPHPRGASLDSPERIARGERSYRIYCASCHGPLAQGHGPMEEALKIPPGDLTDLARRHGGRFPSGQVYLQIEGTDEILGHGSREMPVWGSTFQLERPGAESRGEVEGKIWDLVAYLASVQDTQPSPTLRRPAGDGPGGEEPGNR